MNLDIITKKSKKKNSVKSKEKVYIRYTQDKEILINERIIKIETQGGMFEVLNENESNYRQGQLNEAYNGII